MRKVAPDSAGSAASQNSWSVLKAKPTLGRLTVTAENIIHTAKASSSAGTEIARLRLAMDLPVASQKAGSSGRQSCRIALPRLAAGLIVAAMVLLRRFACNKFCCARRATALTCVNRPPGPDVGVSRGALTRGRAAHLAAVARVHLEIHAQAV